MKNNSKAAKESSKTQAQLAAPAPVPAPDGKAKAPKAPKEPAAKVEKDEEPVDRLPTSIEELKASKGGLVTFLFLSGKDKAEIAKELASAFKLSEEQAVKIVRRISGRARFFQRAFSLVPAKLASRPSVSQPLGSSRGFLLRRRTRETAARSGENRGETGSSPRP